MANDLFLFSCRYIISHRIIKSSYDQVIVWSNHCITNSSYNQLIAWSSHRIVKALYNNQLIVWSSHYMIESSYDQVIVDQDIIPINPTMRSSHHTIKAAGRKILLMKISTDENLAWWNPHCLSLLLKISLTKDLAYWRSR